MKTWGQHQSFIKLAGLILLTPLVAWWFGFRQSMDLWQAYRAQQGELQRLRTNDAGRPTAFFTDEVASRQVLDNGILLERLTDILKAGHVTLVKYTPFLTREEGTLRVHTSELVLAGCFASLLSVIHCVERDGRLGNVISCNFRLFSGRAGKERQLRMTLIIQQLSMQE